MRGTDTDHRPPREGTQVRWETFYLEYGSNPPEKLLINLLQLVQVHAGHGTPVTKTKDRKSLHTPAKNTL